MAARSAREAAVLLLQKVFQENSFLSDCFDQETAGLPERDRAFSRRLALGVLEKRTAIDQVLQHFLKSPLRKLKPAIRRILEVSAYELLFLGQASYASVNEAVNLTRRLDYPALSGFVNGVLRSVSREGNAVLDHLDPWSRLGMTEVIREKFSLWYGEERGLRIAEAMTEEKEGTTIRRNTFFCTEEELLEALSEEGLTAEKTGLSRDTYRLTGEIPAYRTKSFEKGLFYIQDLSSCLSGDAVSDLPQGLRVLDVCSAPGGKLLHVLDLQRGTAQAVAMDLTKARTDLIRENLRRMPYPKVQVMEGDASEDHPEFEQKFDLVIADLPCSGLGTIRKNPELLYRTTEKSLSEIEARAQKILSRAGHYVTPGGTLLFSTCTVNPGENDGAAEYFLSAHPDFHPVDFRRLMPKALRDSFSGIGRLQILPDTFPGDGFYIARFQKEKETGQ